MTDKETIEMLRKELDEANEMYYEMCIHYEEREENLRKSFREGLEKIEKGLNELASSLEKKDKEMVAELEKYKIELDNNRIEVDTNTDLSEKYKIDLIENKYIIFNNVSELKDIYREPNMYNGGYVYFLEYGNYIKIGSTQNPYQRIKQLIGTATNYADLKVGRIMITSEHTNFRTNELLYHKKYSQVRKGNTELFSISLEDIISDTNENIVFLDESRKLRNSSNAFCNFVIDIVKGKYDRTFKDIKNPQSMMKETE